MSTPAVRLGFVLSVAMVSIAAEAATNLTLGRAVEGRVGESSEYTLQVPSAGLLTVALHGRDDVNFNVTDEDGQTLPDGSVDSDRYGDTGLETGMVALPSGGKYMIRVGAMGGDSAPYTLHATFLPFAPLARDPDPDGRPGLAKRMSAGQSHDDSVDGNAGDLRDWYTMTAPSAGTFTIATRGRGEGGDIAMEAYIGGDFADSVARSDQDAQGNSANESISLAVEQGDVVHIRVYGMFSSKAEYRISVGFMR